jgi:dephospho-CoA kinase
MRKIGLTGGIGSGKSTVARILGDQGLALVDADAISRAVTQSGGAAMPLIRAALGDSVLATDGSLSRDAMRKLMLSNASIKARLEGILHPLIGEQINQSLARAEQSGAGSVVLDIPLLVEGDSKATVRWRHRLDVIWVVDCLRETQIARVQMRSGWALAQIEAVMTAQASREQRLAAADAVIFNDGLSLKALETEVLALLNLAKA